MVQVKSKKKVLFLALGFPNVSKANNIYTDLMQEFVQKGHEVVVVAPQVAGSNIGMNKEGNVDVLRVKTLPLFNVGAVKKGIANLLLPFQYKKAIKKHYQDIGFDLIIIPTPPITLLSVANWLKKKSTAKLYLILRDIFPQNAVDLRMMKADGLLHRYFRKQEKELYKISDAIGCMSQANVDYVKQHNSELDFDKLHLLPNWEKLPLPVSEPELVSIREKYHITDKFVAVFGGNMGRPQKLENIIKLADACKENEQICFFLIGNGTEKQRIKSMITTFGLNNIQMIDHLPKKEYIQILAASDIGLISLSDEFTIPNFPSKVLTYFGLKKPVLASLDLSTDFGEMLEETKSGLWSEAGKLEDFKTNLLWFLEHKAKSKKMGENGYEYMKTKLTPEIAHNTIIKEVGLE